jgi:taurine---2-oxoglutarate transaminase
MSVERPNTEREVLEMSRAYNFYTWSPQKNAMEHIAIKGAKDCYFWDYNNNKYLDAASTLVNVNIGFQNQKVIDAIKAQADELCYAGPAYSTAIRSMLGKKIITEIVPEMGKVLFTLGGADANEYALRLANTYTGKYKILSQYMSYHGSTYGASNLNGQCARGNIDPGIAGFVHFMGPWWQDHGLNFDSEEEYSAFLLRLLEKTIIQEGPNKIAAIVTESMQGGGGATQMPKGYMKGIRALCDKYGILMILDEVMVGFGRTGKWFTFMHYDVMPDMITFAKGSTCGATPLGGLIVSKKIAEYFEDVDLPAGLTYNAHPICCAAALATLEIYTELNLFENAVKMGERLLAGLKTLCEKHKSVTRPRGLGLMTGVDLAGPLIDDEIHEKIKQMFISKGVIPYVLPPRIIVSPPLIVTAEEIDKILNAMDEVLTETDKML